MPETPEAQDRWREAEARQLIEAAARADFEAASSSFNAAMTAALPQAKLAAVWASVEHQLGRFQAIESIEIVQGTPERSGANHAQ
jgi:hypothetical protein